MQSLPLGLSGPITSFMNALKDINIDAKYFTFDREKINFLKIGEFHIGDIIYGIMQSIVTIFEWLLNILRDILNLVF